MLERAHANEWSTFEKPERPNPAREVQIKRAFLDPGWTEQQIAARAEIDRQRLLEVPTTSAGVAKQTEFGLERLRSALARGLESFAAENIHFAVEPKAGPFVSMVNVPLTDQTIIAVGTHFTRYCGLIARAYVRTMHLYRDGTGLAFEEAELRRRLRQHPELILYWWRVLSSFALTGTHYLTTFKPSRPDEVIEMEQMAFAMEMFAIAHEYAHHHLGHGRQLTEPAAAREEEFRADMLAMKICEQIEAAERVSGLIPVPNPFLYTGAGAALLLGSLELFRKVKAKIFANRRFDTHPAYAERTLRLKRRFLLEPTKHLTTGDFVASAENVLHCVALELAPIMQHYPFDNLAKLVPDDWEVAQG